MHLLIRSTCLRGHPYIMSAKGLGGWVQKNVNFCWSSILLMLTKGGWDRKSPKMWWLNIGMVPYKLIERTFSKMWKFVELQNNIYTCSCNNKIKIINGYKKNLSEPYLRTKIFFFSGISNNPNKEKNSTFIKLGRKNLHN